MAGKRYSVLLVDDSEDDRWFMRRALEQNSRFHVVGEVCDGEAAIAYLSGDGDFQNRKTHPFPDVVLLDLKMPRVDGHDVLRWLKTQNFKDLFVAVVSGSFLPEDVSTSISLGARVHYQKNAFQEEQKAVVEALESILADNQNI